MNKLYSEGLLDSQTYTQTSDQCNATLENDPHLVALMGGGAMPENTNMWVRKEGDWQDWTLLPPLKGPDGVQYAYTGLNTYYNNCCGVVSADCQYPEIAVQLFDLLASPEGTNVQSYGIEGIQWRWTTEGSNLVGGTPVYEKLTPEHTLADGTIDFSAYGYTCKSSTWDSDASIGGRTSKGREEEGITGDPKMYSESILQEAAIVYDPYSYNLDTIVPNMKELIARYTPDLLYSDGGLPFAQYAPGTPQSQLDAQYREGLDVVADLYNASLRKYGQNRAVYTQKDRHPEIYHVGVLDIEKSQLAGIQKDPWQTDTCIGNWFYDVRQTYKHPDQIIEMLIDIASKNGTMARLEMYYHGRATLAVESAPRQGTKVTLRVPVEEEGKTCES